jgi:hypothetical protein
MFAVARISSPIYVSLITRALKITRKSNKDIWNYILTLHTLEGFEPGPSAPESVARTMVLTVFVTHFST